MPSVVCPSASFFFNDTATTEIYTLSLHDALPISALTCAFSLLLLLLGFWDRKRRLSMAFATTTFALLVMIAGCGGGSSSGGGGGGGNPGTPVGTTTVVITGTSGTIERSVTVSLVVN